MIDPNVQQKDIEYLSKAIDDMSKAFARLEGKIDGMTQTYARQSEVDKEHERLDQKIIFIERSFKERAEELEQDIKENTNWRWKMVGLGVAATMVIPILTALVLRAI